MKEGDVSVEEGSEQYPSLKELESFTRPRIGVPLRGYLTNEDEDHLWIEDREGTWIISKSDLIATEEWDGEDQRYKGEPVFVFVKDGADIYEVKPYKVKVGQSIVLGNAQEHTNIEGGEVIQALESQWIRHLGFRSGERLGPLEMRGTTVCCYDSPGGFGATCTGDDCGVV